MHRDMRSPLVRMGRLSRAALAAGLLMVAAGAAATMADRTATPSQPGREVAVRALAAGKLLVAARSLPDPNFAESVVLLIQYSPDGAAGLVLNRQSDVPLSNVLPGVVQDPAAGAAFVGGPVSPTSVLALSRIACGACPRVGADVYLVNTPDALRERLATRADTQDVRVFLGYAGWGGGQLEAETRTGAWHVLDSDARFVFDREPESLWRRAIRRSEAVLALAAPLADRRNDAGS